MPQVDGFPTNEELLEEFTQRGRDIYVTALEHLLEDGTPDPLKGKLLGDLVLRINHPLGPETGQTIPVEIETLKMQTMSVSDGLFVTEDHEQWQGTPLAGTIDAEAQKLSDIRLGDIGFTPSQIGIWGICTAYVTRMRNTRSTRHVNTLEEEPSGQTLLAGIALEASALKYVQSPEFNLHVTMQKLLRFRLNEYGGAQPSTLNLSHEWSMPFRAGMVFNGYESSQSLRLNIVHARELYTERFNRWASFESQGAPAENIEDYIKKLEDYRRLVEEAHISLESAKEALERRDH